MTRDEKLTDIKDHPDRHQHTFEDLQRCCTHDGALDARIMEAHALYARTATNGGRHCDVTKGPCACGAWH